MSCAFLCWERPWRWRPDVGLGSGGGDLVGLGSGGNLVGLDELDNCSVQLRFDGYCKLADSSLTWPPPFRCVVELELEVLLGGRLLLDV